MFTRKYSQSQLKAQWQVKVVAIDITKLKSDKVNAQFRHILVLPESAYSSITSVVI